MAKKDDDMLEELVMQGPAADPEKAELKQKPPSTLPSDAPINAKQINPNSRAADHGMPRFTCRGAGAGFPELYFAAENREAAEALYRRMHGLDYHAHIHVFVNALED